MEVNNLFQNIYAGKTVFLTGHTGFKGSWLSLWLTQLGAKVVGYSLEPITQPSHIDILNLDIESHIGDIRDLEKLSKVMSETKPDIVFHLAAQALVRDSYTSPIETYDTNVMGTLKVFEAARKCETVKAIVNVTTDKCYENKEWNWAYRENEPMGGYDPYSSSKGCSEILTSSYRNSYFNLADFKKKHEVLLASARAGNVIGGGDWAKDRLIPDIMRSAANSQIVDIRSPRAIRPWQHVLEPLSGYLILGQQLLQENTEAAQGWNFGPSEDSVRTVKEVADLTNNSWGQCQYNIHESDSGMHEAKLLKLDSSMAKNILRWKNIWDSNEAIEYTTKWYRDFYIENKINTMNDLSDYSTKLRLSYE